MVPDPNWLVVPDRGGAMPDRGGVGSAATNEPVMNSTNMQAQSASVRRNRSGSRMELSSWGS